MTVADLDPRWEWIEVRRFSEQDSSYVKGRCNHLDVVPVNSVVDSETVAHLCATCDQQLPAEWRP